MILSIVILISVIVVLIYFTDRLDKIDDKLDELLKKKEGEKK